MAFVKKQPAKPKESHFAQNVNALSQLVNVGGRLAFGVCGSIFLIIVSGGLASAFTAGFVKIAFAIFIGLTVFGMFGAYKVLCNLIAAGEDMMASYAEAERAKKETAKLQKELENQKSQASIIQLQQSTLKSAFGAIGNLPAPGAASTGSSVPPALRPSDISLDIEDATNGTSKKKKNAFVFK